MQFMNCQAIFFVVNKKDQLVVTVQMASAIVGLVVTPYAYM